MKRKVLSVLFISFYLLFTFGFTISSHFCGDNLVGLELMRTADRCHGEEEDDTDDCCSTDNEIIFLINHQEPIKVLSFLASSDALIIDCADPSPYLITAPCADYRYSDLPPPEIIPSYILYCSFTFYG